MAPPTLPQFLLIAQQNYAAGHYSAAESLCRKILVRAPKSTAALRLLSRIADRTGSAEPAAAFLRQAVAAAPDDPTLLAELGQLYQRWGRLDDAIDCYRKAVDLHPDDTDALGPLADALYEKHAYVPAAEIYHRAWECRPTAVELLVRQGDALQGAGLCADAAAAYRQALAQRAAAAGSSDASGKANNADPVASAAIHLKLARALHHAARLNEAVAACQQALTLDPQLASAHEQLGLTLHQKGDFTAALESFDRAIAIDPAAAQTHVYHGQTLVSLGLTEDAVAAYRRALILRPDDADLAARMEDNLHDKAVLDISILAHRERIIQKPDDAGAHFDLGLALLHRRWFDAAIDAFRHVLALQPNHVAALNDLALLLAGKGHLDEAISLLRHAINVHPEVSVCHSSLLTLLHFHPASDAPAIYREHLHWQQRHAQPLQPLIQPHDNNRSPQRPLRIGYVSPDFVTHPVGRFVNAFFPCHDHEQFEIICYASLTRGDAITDKLRQCADRWVESVHLSDEALAQRIRNDRIDILVDLTMHLAHSRLLAFARKPAPIQITYLAYCSTTGLAAMDYRLTDPHLDPPGQDQSCYCERSVHLPRSYWCYHPGLETPAVQPLPALSRGYVTFASLNNFSKVSPAALELWVRVMQATPLSHLILHTVEGDHRQRVRNLFAARGIAPDRLHFFDHVSLPEYFQQLHQVDIALDSFPYPGGTTTLDALWMGIPTVSLVGQAAFTRAGQSIFANLGLPELATTSHDEYLAAAVALAHDLPRLAQLRATLRPRLQNSPLMDAPRFARDLEAIYRSLWQQWCNR